MFFGLVTKRLCDRWGAGRLAEQKFGNFSHVYACENRFTSSVPKMVEIGAG